DEPASVLLERIKAERVRLVKEGELKKAKPLEPATLDEVPFDMPDGWAVQRFGDITNTVGGVTKGRKLAGRKTASYPYLRVANVQRWFVNLDVMKEIEIPVEELGKYKLLHGDLLITEGGDWDKVGRTAIWEGQIENCLHQNHVFRSRLFVNDLCRDWLVLTLNSPVGREYFAGSSKQTTNLASINMTQLKHFPMPVPPVEEQKRIVAKVNQLMTLCDELEAKLSHAQQQSAKLMESTVRQLLVA
uniref:restriction endonuclease subunit S n=1 Tax=Trichloromonas sp. TaxID=3069249 RepID=UPI003D813168